MLYVYILLYNKYTNTHISSSIDRRRVESAESSAAWRRVRVLARVHSFGSGVMAAALPKLCSGSGVMAGATGRYRSQSGAITNML